jgi:hypothetical protein
VTTNKKTTAPSPGRQPSGGQQRGQDLRGRDYTKQVPEGVEEGARQTPAGRIFGQWGREEKK